jgi:GNAT superfamily N-acetyltransferase
MSLNLDNLIIKSLEPQHEVGAFYCGTTETQLSINRYLTSGDAWNDQIKGISSTTLYYYEDRIVGFYTARCSEIQVRDLSETDVEELEKPHCTVVSTIEITVFAVHSDFQNQGIGSAMMDVIISETIELTRWLGCRYIIVHADEDAVPFYIKKEFVRIEANYYNGLIPMKLFIPSYHYLQSQGIYDM